MADQVLGVADGETVLPEQILHGIAEDALAAAFGAAQHEGDSPRLSGCCTTSAIQSSTYL